ncbi:hypothetical protein BDZ97DRAFT_1926197 [Flammula alnicola]|nr:hypothetical protein BDZ97DRAFT_1926197 [Flammula alnicola]
MLPHLTSKLLTKFTHIWECHSTFAPPSLLPQSTTGALDSPPALTTLSQLLASSETLTITFPLFRIWLTSRSQTGHVYITNVGHPLPYPISPALFPASTVTYQQHGSTLSQTFNRPTLPYSLPISATSFSVLYLSTTLTTFSQSTIICQVALFYRYGFTFLSQLGQWDLDLTSYLPLTFCPFHLAFSPAQNLIARDWPIVSSWLSSLPSYLSSLSYPDITLLFPQLFRQYLAEHIILALSQFSSAFPHQAPRHLFSSNASHVNHGHSSSVNFAVITNGNTFSASLNAFGPRPTILQGEAYGIVAAFLLARQHQTQCSSTRNAGIDAEDFGLAGIDNGASTTVYTDHLNSVHFINSFNTSTSLTSHPACSLYCWILNIRSPTSPRPTSPSPAQVPTATLRLEHVRAHTSSTSLPSALNCLADHIASSSQWFFVPPPAVPVPTFTMDLFTPYSSSSGFIESNLATHIDQALSRNMSTYPLCIVSHLLYDANSPPQYPYLHALSSYSAVIQLYS